MGLILVFNTNNHNLFTNELHRINWEQLFNLENTNDNFNLFSKKVMNVTIKIFQLKQYMLLLKDFIMHGLQVEFLNLLNINIIFKMYKLGTVSHEALEITLLKLFELPKLIIISKYLQIFVIIPKIF